MSTQDTNGNTEDNQRFETTDDDPENRRIGRFSGASCKTRVNGEGARARRHWRALPAADSFAALPIADQQRLRALGQEARNLFGRLRDVQEIVARHLGLLEYLIANGADHEMLGNLLAQVGVARPDGTPLPRGTLSSALSRARGRATPPPAPPGRERPEAAGPGRARPHIASPGSTVHGAAGDCSSMQEPAAAGRERRDAAEPGTGLHGRADICPNMHEPDTTGPEWSESGPPRMPPAISAPDSRRRDPIKARGTPAAPASPSSIAPPTNGAPTLARPTAPPAASTSTPPYDAGATLATQRAAHLLNMLRSTEHE